MGNKYVSSSSSSAGIGFSGLWFITFIVLKIIGILKLSWFWTIVLCVAPALLVIVVIISLIIFTIWISNQK